jgi:hypothetical protein
VLVGGGRGCDGGVGGYCLHGWGKFLRVQVFASGMGLSTLLGSATRTSCVCAILERLTLESFW